MSRDGDRLILNVILTPREVELMRLLADGLAAKVIAAKLHLAPSTVTWMTHELYVALSVTNRVEVYKFVLANKDLKAGLALEVPPHRLGCLCRHCEAA